ncbi:MULTISPECIES: PadR family transcriptional regulator [Priestia]|uniref:PadR family transcriptional regulator n=1 Tax=Priestia TaxID=2800373 RepID=UPI000BFE0CC2|nr:MULTISPECIES: PadR family transcriptional regulator [Priestia]AVX08599.1 PadR family transcriptional regulator [Bacillus sp. Y-01]MCG0047007.1 PadR family transcriptional regulator [Priestia aryabhattai]PGZ81049.1 transcriptional regulator [Priestia megaterium]
MKENQTTYAILGLLTTECRTGYEIKQLMDRSLNHFWKISYGQIYPTLQKLLNDELATVNSVAQTDKPDKKEYVITTKGKEVLQNWLREPIKQLPSERNEILLKLFFSSQQEKQLTISQLKNAQQKLTERYHMYCGIEDSISNSPSPDRTYWLITLDYGKRTTCASIEWCKDTINKLYDEEAHNL